MCASPTEAIAQLPDEIMFSILRPAAAATTAATTGARLGTLRLRGRKVLQTPHYLGITSRGVIPHLSQDTFARHTDISGVYMALEDYIEKGPALVPPIYQFQQAAEDTLSSLEQQSAPPSPSPLRHFVALPDDTVLVLGARRSPPITCPIVNTTSSIAILTSVGFRQLSVREYAEAANRLRPDIVVGLGDVPFGLDKISRKKTVKMTDRTGRWTDEHVEAQKRHLPEAETLDTTGQGNSSIDGPALFAPLLPLDVAAQAEYINQLCSLATADKLHGLAIYSTAHDAVQSLPSPLLSLPKLAFTEPKSPHAVLRSISDGIDIFTIPFITAATDAGIALDFVFPAPSISPPALDSPAAPTSAHMSAAHEPAEATPEPELATHSLGVDMWHPAHATSLAPLSGSCVCYACATHHRAYVQHLLSAKEMLGWVLLQAHNHSVMDAFFAGVRASLAREGADEFDRDVGAFERWYQAALPEKTGLGPRVRGYQFKSSGPSEPKKNPAAYRALGKTGGSGGKDDKASAAVGQGVEPALPSPSADAADLEQRGFGKAV